MLPHHYIIKDTYTWTSLAALIACCFAIEHQGEWTGNVSTGVFITSMLVFGFQLTLAGRIIRNDYKGEIWVLSGDSAFRKDTMQVNVLQDINRVEAVRTDRINGYAYKLAAGTSAWINDRGGVHTLGLVSGVINHLAGGKVNGNWALQEADKSWEKLITRS